MSSAEFEVVRLSLAIGLQVVIVSLVPAVAVAYWLVRTRARRLAALVRALVMLPLVLPPLVTGYLLLLAFGRRSLLGALWERWTGEPLAYTTAACVLAAAVVGFPLFVESVRLALLAVDPRYERVSRCLGRGPTATFLRVTLPLLLPGVLAGAVLAFARALGEFGATIVLAGNIEGETRQIPLAVYTLLNVPGEEHAVARLVVVSVLLSLLALWAAAGLAHLGRRRAGRA